MLETPRFLAKKQNPFHGGHYSPINSATEQHLGAKTVLYDGSTCYAPVVPRTSFGAVD